MCSYPASGTLSFDPYDPALVDDPYPCYAALRREAPAYYGAERDFWALSRFADVKAALNDAGTYCSSQGLLVLEKSATYEAPVFPPGNLLLMDPPRHTAYRGLINRRFLQRGIAALEEQIRVIATELIDRFIEAGSVDLVPSFTVALPAMVFAGVLGIPGQDWDVFQHWSAQLVSPAPDAATMAAHHQASDEVSQYFATLLADKRRCPGDDLLSELAVATIDGEPIGVAEAIGFAIAMLIAGNDTTSNLLANGSYLLARHPDQRAALVAAPALMANAIEEMLRYESPVQGLARTLTTDVVVAGEQLRQGQKVLLLFGSANRDEAEFTRADCFDVTRRLNSHLAFGFGVHYCVGIHLARLEARVAFEALLSRLGDYEVAAEAIHWRQLIPTRPMASLPIRFRPGAPVG